MLFEYTYLQRKAEIQVILREVALLYWYRSFKLTIKLYKRDV